MTSRRARPSRRANPVSRIDIIGGENRARRWYIGGYWWMKNIPQSSHIYGINSVYGCNTMCYDSLPFKFSRYSHPSLYMGHGGRGQACQAWAGVPGVSGGAGWYGSPMRTLHIDQGIYYNRKEKEKHEKRAEPAKPGRTAKPENRSRDSWGLSILRLRRPSRTDRKAVRDSQRTLHIGNLLKY